MKCAWEQFLHLLPPWMRQDVDMLGRDGCQELRLRIGSPPQLIVNRKYIDLPGMVREDDMSYIVNAASRYSPWAAASCAKGYITGPGGHRIGLCGDVVIHDGIVTGIRNLSSLCLRVARDFPGISQSLWKRDGSILILGSPGWGKTTLLRDLIRQRSHYRQEAIAVVDERGELFPSPNGRSCFSKGLHTDILTGCEKAAGIEILLRTMGPDCIAVDEITASRDCEAMIQAGWCGVSLLATAHASSKDEYFKSPVYRPLAESGLFSTLVVLHQDRSWHEERMELCTIR